MKYKISIIIPVFNIENYIKDTLESIIRQTIGLKHLEVILVNDCSTDKSGEIIDEYASKFENFIAIHLPKNNGLPGKPRNIGIERATGEYLMFMDHDDCYANDACEVLYNTITRENVDIVFSRYNYVFEDGRIQHSPNHFEGENEIKINSIDENIELLKIAPSLWTKIFKKSVILDNKIRFPEGVLAEDLFFVVQYLLNSNGIVHLNDFFSYYYRIRDSEDEKSTIRIKNKIYLMAMINGYLDIYNMLKDLDKEKFFPIIFKEHSHYWMNCFILSDTNISEKKELLGKVSFLFDIEKDQNLDLSVSYRYLFNDIVNKNFDQAILFSDIMADFKSRENILWDKHHKLHNDFIKNNQKIKKLQKQLDNRKKQVAELQTVSGWLNYKFKNIFIRLKLKVKS